MKDHNGRMQTYTMLTEPGLYALTGASHKKEARDFRDWVHHVVLPSIRKTGAYSLKKRSHEKVWMLSWCRAASMCI